MHSATERGYDDVLFIDKRGLIGRTIHADIIFQFADNLHTPVADVFPNNGPRQAFIDLAHEQGIKVYERHILPRDIGYVKEAFLVDFRRGITPLRSIGGVRCEVSVLRSRIEY